MTLDEIKSLIEFIKGHDLSEFELEQDGVKIRIKSTANHHVVTVPHMPAMPMVTTAPVAAAPQASAPAAPAASETAADDGGELCIV
ncbi:MAG TPA: hypothetical protein VEA16_23535, partial [Vicinamibacterales bacterium]|nr:hypothetical protein [Vicinamibacterales bacterium]